MFACPQADLSGDCFVGLDDLAILAEHWLDPADVVSSLVYFKHRTDFGLFDEYCRDHGIKLPHIKLHADVCRDDLLFELELEAVKTV